MGRIHRGMEGLVPLKGLGRMERSWALSLHGPTGHGGLFFWLKTHVPCRGSQNPFSLSRMTWHLVTWRASRIPVQLQGLSFHIGVLLALVVSKGRE